MMSGVLELKAASLALSLCRSVISYKTDQKPLFSNDVVANAGRCRWKTFILFLLQVKFEAHSGSQI